MYQVVTPVREITPLLLGEFIQYLDTSAKTVQTYNRALRQFMVYLSARNIKTPQRADIIAYRDYLAESHKSATVVAYLQAVKLFFQWCELQNLYPDIAKHIKVKTDSRVHKKDALTSRQIKEILAAIDKTTEKGMRDYALITLMVTTGLRANEVAQADIGDIRTIADTTCLFIQGKGRTDKTDYVIVPHRTEQILRAYLEVRKAAELTEPLFTSTSNRSLKKRISTRTVSQIAKDSFRRVGIDSERITCHSLRHSAITLSLLNGNTLQEASQFARHSSINTTQIYAHNLDKLHNGCSESIAEEILDK